MAQPSPATVFEAAGLSSGILRRITPVPSRVQVEPGRRLRDALNELGGLYSLFGEFLSWRADLLRSEALVSLETVARHRWALDREQAAEVLRSEFGERGEKLASGLRAEANWKTGFRCAWRARLDGQEVVVQFSHAGFDDRDFRLLERGLARLDEETLSAIKLPPVLAQFRHWARLGESPSGERRLLEALQTFSTRTLTEFPAPIPELCSDRVVCYRWMEGRPALDAIRGGDREALQKLAESVLEQICLYSLVDAELNAEAYVLTPGGAIAMRYPARFAVIPAVHLRSVLKYLSSALAGNATAAAHALLRLAGRGAEDDARMLDALSAIAPDLKVNLVFPPSAGLFENQWRALARLQEDRPLYLDCLHRSLIGLAYQGARFSSAAGGEDMLEQAFWPVLGRLLRTRIGELMTREAASDWLLSGGLLVFEGLRQVNRFAEDLRDDDLSLRVRLANGRGIDVRANRRVGLSIVGAMLLAAMVLCLRWGVAASGALSIALAAGAIGAAIGLFWIVTHLD